MWGSYPNMRPFSQKQLHRLRCNLNPRGYFSCLVASSTSVCEWREISTTLDWPGFKAYTGGLFSRHIRAVCRPIRVIQEHTIQFAPSLRARSHGKKTGCIGNFVRTFFICLAFFGVFRGSHGRHIPTYQICNAKFSIFRVGNRRFSFSCILRNNFC